MNDIAARAGVSRTTVSFVLNKKHRSVGISEDTQIRVLEAAAQLGYRRNEIARAMVTGRSRVLAFLVNDPESEVAGRILAGALEAAEENQYFIKVIRADKPNGADVVRQCAELRLAGVMTLYLPKETLEHLQTEMARYHIPVAVLDSSFPQPRGIRVISDDPAGCHLAVDHLAGLGHRRIAFIAGIPDSGASVLREQGYRAAMAEAGLPILDGFLAHGHWEITRIEQTTRSLFREAPEPPTAVFCADDKTALVAARTIRKLGLRVPEDVSVVGFADLRMACYGDPPLTTVAQPFSDMGRVAVSRLLSMAQEIQKDQTRAEIPVEEFLPTQLLIRESTAPVNAVACSISLRYG